jgi:hypothetical protein
MHRHVQKYSGPKKNFSPGYPKFLPCSVWFCVADLVRIFSSVQTYFLILFSGLIMLQLLGNSITIFLGKKSFESFLFEV